MPDPAQQTTEHNPFTGQTYQPDPDEEAYYASPEGLRAGAAQMRRLAALHIERAEAMEAEAADKEQANVR